MDLNLGLTGDSPNKERDAMRRRLAAQLLAGEKMPDQISSPKAARGLVLASALKSLAGTALTIQQDRRDAEQSAKWGEIDKHFSSLLGGGDAPAPERPMPAPQSAPAAPEPQAASLAPSMVSIGARLPQTPTTSIMAQVPSQFRELIQQASTKYGVPADLIAAQMKQESGFRPDAVSKTGAKGLMQILDSTARDPGYGMQGVDPATLRDPAANIDFGVRYLAARAKSSGLDLNVPEQRNKALRLYGGADTAQGDKNYDANVLRHLGVLTPEQKAEFLRAGERSAREAEARGNIRLTIGPNGLAAIDPEQEAKRHGRNSVSMGSRSDPPEARTAERSLEARASPDMAAMLTGGQAAAPAPATDRGAAMASRLTPEGVARVQQAAIAAVNAGHPRAAMMMQVANQQAALLDRQDQRALLMQDREEARRQRAEDRADTRGFQERQFAFQQQQAADGRAFQERQFQDTADGRRQQREMAERQFESQRQQAEQGRLPPGYRMGANGQAEAIPGLPPPAGERAPEGYRWNADRTAMEPIPGGPAEAQRAAAAGARTEADAGRQRATENDLRGEYTKLTADFRTVQDAHGAIRAAAKSQNGAGDMSMLYSFVKLLDPTSVVRETEFAMAAASGSYGERIQGAVQRLATGERLPDSLRGAFLAEADNLLAARRQSYDQMTTAYRGLAERSGARPDQVLVPFAREPTPMAARQTPEASRGGSNAPPGPTKSGVPLGTTTEAVAQAEKELPRGMAPDQANVWVQRRASEIMGQRSSAPPTSGNVPAPPAGFRVIGG